jgi:hypothetical protein
MPTSTEIPIATTTLGGSVSTYTFSSIPSTYTDLVLVTNLTSGSNANIYFRVNGDTASNYSSTFLSGDGTSANSARTSNVAQGTATWTGASMNTNFTTCVANFMNYSNATTYKTFITRYAGYNTVNQGEATAVVNLWRSTAAINSITVLSLSPNYSNGSTLTLYGIN